jgi:deoxyribodipyrimidine photo-lyase
MGADPPPLIVWFRRDLRLADNPALHFALASGRPVLAVYILDEDPRSRPLGGAQRWWLDRSLRALSDDVARLGGRLILRRGAPARVLAELIAETGATGVYWNRLYDAGSIDRDSRIKADLIARGLDCRSFNAALLIEPWDIATDAGEPYSVFSPFWRKARARLPDGAPLPPPAFWPAARSAVASEDLDLWALSPRAPDWSRGFSNWRPGEAAAWRRLDAFLSEGADAYGASRNRPDLEGTSRLSPHLAFGEIGPRQIAHALWQGRSQTALSTGREIYLKELGWREFSYHLLYYNPELARKNFKSKFDDFPWRDDRRGFRAWKRGLTGYPIVDAGMRQLWATGWMHNRVRMIVASFLIKDLMIDWRQGEAWFWDTLLDADPANNAASWQWVAGCGADAAPYFRIFNPTSQGAKFDPSGDYVRRWAPELAHLPDETIHAPWTAPAPPDGYPRPIVDHARVRLTALAAFEALG